MDRIFIKRAWYMVAWADEIAAGDKHKVMVMNAPIVLYRDTGGALVALEGRCCHRAAPLSIGRIEGDDLRCMYHGLKFDRTGRCVEIPGQDRIPPHACRCRNVASADHATAEHHWESYVRWGTLEVQHQLG